MRKRKHKNPLMSELLSLYNGVELFALNSFAKNTICEYLGINRKTLEQELTKLVDSGTLRCVGRDTYQET